MKHKVSELEGALLDAAVAKAEGNELTGMASLGAFSADHRLYLRGEFGSHKQFSPSTEWALGGQIVEREKLLLAPLEHGGWRAVHLPSGNDGPQVVVARLDVDGEQETFTAASPTVAMEAKYPLVAAMRAYVASKFGETVELP